MAKNKTKITNPAMNMVLLLTAYIVLGIFILEVFLFLGFEQICPAVEVFG